MSWELGDREEEEEEEEERGTSVKDQIFEKKEENEGNGSTQKNRGRERERERERGLTVTGLEEQKDRHSLCKSHRSASCLGHKMDIFVFDLLLFLSLLTFFFSEKKRKWEILNWVAGTKPQCHQKKIKKKRKIAARRSRAHSNPNFSDRFFVVEFK